MSTPYSKYSGLGNDFIFFDNRALDFPVQPLIIQRLCDRKSSIGADGVVLVEPSQKADYKMRIFNSDGSEAEMCGNGLRCYYLFLKELGLGPNSFSVEIDKKVRNISKKENSIVCEMGDVNCIEGPIKLAYHQLEFKAYYLNTGVPHVVVFVDDVDKIPVNEIGQSFRFHPHFDPNGANVNFVQLCSKNKLLVRTYERGVEAETKACGTGCCASAIMAAKVYGLKSPVTALPSLKDPLTFEFINTDEGVSHLMMKGPAQHESSGSINLNLVA